MNRPSDWHKAQPPMRHQKGWPKIVNAGCQGSRDYWGEFDCVYPWDCGVCPVFWHAEDKRAEEFIGPPSPGYITFD